MPYLLLTIVLTILKQNLFSLHKILRIFFFSWWQ